MPTYGRCVFIAGAVIYSFIYGNIGQFIQNLYSSGQRYRKRMDEINEFVRFHNLPATLQVLAARLAKLADEAQWSLLSIELQLHARRDPAFAERHREGKAACYRMFGELVADLTQRFALRPALPPMQTGIGLYAVWMGLAVQGDVEGAMPRDEMLVGFFRAMAGLGSSHEEQAYS